MSTKLRTIVRVFSKDQIIHIQNHGEYRVKDIPEELLDLTVRCIKHKSTVWRYLLTNKQDLIRLFGEVEDSAYGYKVGNIYIRFDGGVTLVIYAENQEKEAELKAKMLENYYNFLGIDRHIIRCNWIN